ncbi:MAG: PH domain-containing protein, partial [Planctomycetes bacterium]|nr:PH domain-containing protein [Planctomycetota bacterium]
ARSEVSGMSGIDPLENSRSPDDDPAREPAPIDAASSPEVGHESAAEVDPVAGPAFSHEQLSASTPEPQERLDPKVVVYWLVSGLISWVFLGVLLGGVALFAWFKWSRFGMPVAIAVGAIAVLLLVWTLISPTLAYNRWRFSVGADLLLARYGILFIEEKAIPISRMQHIDLYRGVVERMLGLTTLIVFTAGTEGAHFRLPGLSLLRARELRDLILAARGDDVI